MRILSFVILICVFGCVNYGDMSKSSNTNREYKSNTIKPRIHKSNVSGYFYVDIEKKINKEKVDVFYLNLYLQKNKKSFDEDFKLEVIVDNLEIVSFVPIYDRTKTMSYDINSSSFVEKLVFELDYETLHNISKAKECSMNLYLDDQIISGRFSRNEIKSVDNFISNAY